MRRLFPLVAATLACQPAGADEVGQVDLDLVTEDIVIEALDDPEIEGVTCYIAYLEPSLIDRLSHDGRLEDAANASIACRQTGPIDIGDIDRSLEGEEVFRERRLELFKIMRITRIFDEERGTLIYLAHFRELIDGSANMSISTVPLYAARR